MTSRQRYSSFNCRARGQTEYNLERNTSRSSSKASHSNNVCWIVSDSRDSQQGHCALRTSCVRLLELRRSWQPNRNFVFNLRPSRRDEGHVLSKYSGKPKRSFSAQLLMLRRVDILLKPSASSETRRDATNSLTNFFAAGFFRGPGQFASDARFSRNKAPFLDDPRPLESFIRPSYTRRTRKSRGSNDKMLLRNFNAAAFIVSGKILGCKLRTNLRQVSATRVVLGQLLHSPIRRRMRGLYDAPLPSYSPPLLHDP